MHTHTCILTHAHTHTCTYSHMHTHTCTYSHMHTHTCTLTHAHTHTCTLTHAHIHTCTHRRNILPTANSSFLKTCRFDNSSEDGLYCPILSLQQIVDMIDASDGYFRNLSMQVCVRVCVHACVCMCVCVSLASHTLCRGRKGLVTLQPSSCRHDRNLSGPIRSALFVDHIYCHGAQLLHNVFSGCQHLTT